MAFDITTPDVEIERDQTNQVVQLRHPRKRYSAQNAGIVAATPAQLAIHYVRDVGQHYGLSHEELSSLSEAIPSARAMRADPGMHPTQEGTRLRQSEEKSVSEISVVAFQQTCRGLPVWNSNLSVVISGDPPQVISSSSTLHPNMDLPSLPNTDPTAFSSPQSLREALGIDYPEGQNFSFNGSRLLVYYYDPEERFDREAQQEGSPSLGMGSPAADTGAGEMPPEEKEGPADAGDIGAGDIPAGPGGLPPLQDSLMLQGFSGETDTASSTVFQKGPPILPLPPEPDSIAPGRHYVVREILFTLTMPVWGELHWRAFVEPDSRAVLYLRALTTSATCCVFLTDPVSSTGTLLTGASPASELDPVRTCNLNLQNLDPPTNNVQALRGRFAVLTDTDAPAIPPPTETSPFSFQYSAVTDHFAAANAYYHTDAMYRLVESFGFPASSYFDGTVFPVPVDHRGEGGGVNAHAHGNTTGTGMGRFRYGLVQSGQPVGIAASARVCLHEFGHTLLWDHVGSPNFGWCHSAGDTLAAILHDAGSHAPDRFATFPFLMASNPGLQRRHDRAVGDGWGFGGTRDDRQYGTEQILSTLMFRIYRVTGGDDGDITTQRFAARYLAFLIIKAIGTLTATTTNPRIYVTALENADQATTNFEGHPGGAWHKLFPWSFAKQGLSGVEPAVDIYIDDGRNGEYEPYLPDFGNSPDIWNRLAGDGGTANQAPVAGITNYLYVRVRNRGTSAANNVIVNAFQGSGALRWPTDWIALSTASLPGNSIVPGGQTVVGPFQWTPQQSGQLSVLASASATGDTSNADAMTSPISNARLVPFDNNIAQRDFTVGAGGDRACIRIAGGSTTPGATDWQSYGNNTGIFVDVDTSSGGFTSTPRYFSSVGGRSSHWATTGGTSIYTPTANKFRIYLRWANGQNITPAQANNLEWHINWVGVED